MPPLGRLLVRNEVPFHQVIGDSPRGVGTGCRDQDKRDSCRITLPGNCLQVVPVGIRRDTNLLDGRIGVRTQDLVDQVLDCLPEVAVVVEPAGQTVSTATCRVNRLLRIGAAISLPVIVPAVIDKHQVRLEAGKVLLRQDTTLVRGVTGGCQYHAVDRLVPLLVEDQFHVLVKPLLGAGIPQEENPLAPFRLGDNRFGVLEAKRVYIGLVGRINPE